MPKRNLWGYGKSGSRDKHVRKNTTSPDDSDGAALGATLGGPGRRPSNPGYGPEGKAHKSRKAPDAVPEERMGGASKDGGQ